MDVVREATYEGYHTRVVQLHHRYGMIMFIASEVMFFVAWFWAFFDAALLPSEPMQFAAHRAHRRHLAAQGHRDLRPLAPAAAQHADPAHLRHDRHLGAPRAAARRPPGPEAGPVADHHPRRPVHRVQAYEYTHAGFGFSGNIYGATFFMATGFHGAHVIIGTIFLAVCLFRAYLGHFTPTAASRLRVRRLVLALRRRGLAVPVRRIYVWGSGGDAAAALTAGRGSTYGGRLRAALFRFRRSTARTAAGPAPAAVRRLRGARRTGSRDVPLPPTPRPAL